MGEGAVHRISVTFYLLLAFSISLVSSLASVTAILMIKNNPESKAITIIPITTVHEIPLTFQSNKLIVTHQN